MAVIEEQKTPIFDEAEKKEYIQIIKTSIKGGSLSNRETSMLFYWARHQNDEMFDFVPDRYKLNPTPSSKKKSKKAGSK